MRARFGLRHRPPKRTRPAANMAHPRRASRGQTHHHAVPRSQQPKPDSAKSPARPIKRATCRACPTACRRPTASRRRANRVSPSRSRVRPSPRTIPRAVKPTATRAKPRQPAYRAQQPSPASPRTHRRGASPAARRNRRARPAKRQPCRRQRNPRPIACRIGTPI